MRDARARACVFVYARARSGCGRRVRGPWLTWAWTFCFTTASPSCGRGEAAGPSAAAPESPVSVTQNVTKVDCVCALQMSGGGGGGGGGGAALC